MTCEECGNDKATCWAHDLALCTDCAEMLDALDVSLAGSSPPE